MKSAPTVLVMSVVLLVSTGAVPAAFGQQDPIVVTVDKESYIGNDTIMVTGSVSSLYPTQVTMWVTAPNGNWVAVGQIPVGQDKMFGITVPAGGEPWMAVEGIYTLTVQYGPGNHQASTTFEYVRDDHIIVDDFWVPNHDHDVTAEISGGAIHSVFPLIETNSLLANITADDDGILTITIPRSIADATLDDGSDGQYFVLVDGEEREFYEVTTNSSRTLTIEFEAGAEQIEIIGTWVIPEFGTIAVLILAVAIVSVIVSSSRSRLNAIPRY